jgi:uncharacterized surface protein with fasciclin (FAS1) repeats
MSTVHRRSETVRKAAERGFRICGAGFEVTGETGTRGPSIALRTTYRRASGSRSAGVSSERLSKKLLRFALLVMILGVACATSNVRNNLIDVLEREGRFTTLLRIVRDEDASRFLDFMTSDRALTLFAPPDEVFDALPPREVEAIFQEAERAPRLLAYHLASATLRASDLEEVAQSDDPFIRTGGCCMIRVALEDHRLMVNNATVVETDLEASNGVIHVVDQVIEPTPA